MSSKELTTYLPLAIAVLVVVRLAVRELRERVVRTPQIWIRPGILVLVTGFLVVSTFTVDARDDVVAIVASIAGAILGAITGFGIVRNTTFAPAGVPGAARVRGAPITLAIWIGAFVVRFLARFLYPGGADPRAQLPLNCGTVVMLTVAVIVIALAFQRAIAAYAGAPSVSTSLRR